MSAVRLSLMPLTLAEANAHVERLHRHHRPVVGHLFSIGVDDGEEVRGVAIVGRPLARMLQDGYTAEVTRCCTDGAHNACSMLYGAAWRACKAMGYRRLVTYTLPEEGGTSLRSAGWRLIGEAGGGSWSRTDRPRIDLHPTQTKLRWEAVSNDGGSMQIEMVDPEGTLLREVEDKRMKQADVALTYAFALRSPDTINWARVNRAIIDRWSVTGLQNVKKLAWDRQSEGHSS